MRILFVLSIAAAIVPTACRDSAPRPTASPSRPAQPTPPITPTSASADDAGAPDAAPSRATKRHVVPRHDLESWAGLPAHAVFTSQMGLAGTGPVSRQVTVDLDTRKLDAADYGYSVPARKPVKRTLTGAEIAQLRVLVEDAWSAPPLAEQHVSDFREVVIAVDDDEGMMISSQGPITPGPSPAARLGRELYRLAGW